MEVNPWVSFNVKPLEEELNISEENTVGGGG